MEWNEKLQRIVDYVEYHLQRKQEPIDPKEISRIAGCSFGFFQKVFSYMNGISFSEYVRFRKMTLAGYELKSTEKRVVDISYQFGYDSPTSFTKAFQQFHGIAPKEARNRDTKLRVVPKMQISERQQYSWNLVRKPGFRLIGKSIRLSGSKWEQQAEILEFWNDCQRSGVFSTLISMDAENEKGLFGVSHYDEESKDEMEYSLMVIGGAKLADGYREILIPEVTWAVFDIRGAVPEAIQNGWKYLQEEWLVKYPFRHALCPELEWYSSGNAYDKDYLSQIWIPIIEDEL